MGTIREIVKSMTPDYLKKYYRTARYRVIRLQFAIFSKLPIRKKRIAICNVWGYGDNPKWIAKALRAKDKSLEIIFITDIGKVDHPVAGVKFVHSNTIAAIRYLSTAHVWVDSNRKEPYIVKRPGQYYIQTWHGSLPLKKIEGDYEGISSEYLANARRDSEMTDLFISNSEFCEEIYRRAFFYDKEFLRAGSARLDPLFKPNSRRTSLVVSDIKKICSFEQGRNSEKNAVGIAVYAPTFREGEGIRPADGFDCQKIIEVLERKYNKEFILVVRLHPLEAATRGRIKGKKTVDGNLFGDLYELLEASDVLITDYSNTLFEFAFTGKPVFLYAPDIDSYTGTRGMYFDYRTLPYPIAENMEELEKNILEYSEENYRTKQIELFKRLKVCEDGHASARIAKIIINKVYKSGKE